MLSLGPIRIAEERGKQYTVETEIIKWQLQTEWPHLKEIEYDVDDGNLEIEFYFKTGTASITIYTDQLDRPSLLYVEAIDSNRIQTSTNQAYVEISQLIKNFNQFLIQRSNCCECLEILNFVNEQCKLVNDQEEVEKKIQEEEKLHMKEEKSYGYGSRYSGSYGYGSHFDHNKSYHWKNQSGWKSGGYKSNGYSYKPPPYSATKVSFDSFDSTNDFQEFADEVAEESQAMEFMMKEKRWEDKALKKVKDIKIGDKVMFDRESMVKLLCNEIKSVILADNQIEIEPIDDDIYHLGVVMNSINEEIDQVVLEIELNPAFYPYSPPVLKFISPTLDSDLEYNIINMEYFKLQNWNPTNELKYTLEQLKIVLEENGKLAEEQVQITDPALISLKQDLIQLSSLTGTVPKEIQEKKIKINFVSLSKAQSSQKNQKFNGTGYGSGHSKGWDIKKYILEEKNKMKNLVILMKKINNQLSTVDPVAADAFLVIDMSCLIPYMTNYFRGLTLLDADKKEELTLELINCIQILANEKSLLLRPIYEVYEDIYLEAKAQVDIFKKRKTDVPALTQTVLQTYKILKDIGSMIPSVETKTSDGTSNTELYVSSLKRLQFNALPLANYLYKKGESLTHQATLRIAQEMGSFQNSLPLSLSSSVFVRSDEDSMNCMKAIITGPEDTPYSGGCFEFDIYLPPNYPNTVPKVVLKTTGKGTFRFNPNLYKNGKVCLSLLGTWRGQQGESWNPEASTLLQVFVSIQSLIMVDKPYFNEPGYERDYGTKKGEDRSRAYNQPVRLKTVELAMLGQLRNPTKGFEKVIQRHFYYRKEKILEEVMQWIEEADDIYKNSLVNAYTQLLTEFDKIVLEPDSESDSDSDSDSDDS